MILTNILKNVKIFSHVHLNFCVKTKNTENILRNSGKNLVIDDEIWYDIS